MPKFVYTVIAGTVLAWYVLLSFISSYAPNSAFTIVVALIIFFVASALTLSLCVYIFAKRKIHLPDHRVIYREALKKGMITAAIITVILAFRVFLIA